MMKNILVLAGGGDNDAAVFATALSAAQPFHEHLEFLHVQIEPGEAAGWEPHAEFLRGSAIRETIQRLRTEAVTRTASARSHFEQFCDVNKVVVSDQPLGAAVSANWREEMGDAERRLMFSARHHDLVVLGRRTGLNGLRPDLIERILLGCGRPLLIAPPQPPRLLFDTVMVCWKETPEAARSLAAAMPLLVNARRVVLAGVEERDPSLAAGLADLSCQLAWHGINAEVDFLSSVAGPVQKVLLAAAQSHNADLLVMGAYGHSRTRQIIFGGFTQSVLEAAEIAVLLMH
jgi:nucleotide-binding universal stress UspA family protein